MLFISFSVISQTTHNITASGFSFSPNDITIAVNDKVVFNTSTNHPIIEVSEATWNANLNDPLQGGFSFSSGSGEVTFTEEGVYYYVCGNHYSSGMKGKITVSNTTNINNNLKLSESRLYPNPLNQDILRVSLSKPANYPVQVYIFDITGKSILKSSFKQNTDEIELDCSGLNSGLYFVQLTSHNSKTSLKFIKKD